MKTIIKKSKLIIPLLLITFTFTSCNLEIFGVVQGNGELASKNINLEPFSKIEVSRGIDVYIEEGNPSVATVEADENLLEIITVEVINETLLISASKNIGTNISKKVIIAASQINSIEVSSGASVSSNVPIKGETLSLDASSGANLNLSIVANEVYTVCSSGADIKVSGKANKLIADASSGSDIHAENLEALQVKASVSSGADIKVNALESLEANASSGGDISYRGNPNNKKINKGSSGAVKRM